jgi:uncharacterized protein (TIGR03790 family)
LTGSNLPGSAARFPFPLTLYYYRTLSAISNGRCPSRFVAILALTLAGSGIATAQSAANVLLVVNDSSQLSRNVGQYYARRRAIPPKNVCHIRTDPQEDIPRARYDREIATPVAACLDRNQLAEQILYIATTAGVPLRIPGVEALDGDGSAVDSELTLLYLDRKAGHPHPLKGGVPNPLFGRLNAKFTHDEFPIYLVTRLAAYDFEGVKASVDACLQAKNRGKFVIDLKDSGNDGDSWLRQAAGLLPKERVVLDTSSKVLYDQTDVIAYASWGSNDRNRHRRFVGFHWLPGSIATEFVSTNGRTFERPPETWTISDWGSRNLWFKGSPQTMTADYLLDGATAATGHVAEPYLAMTPHPEFLLPAYYSGLNLAESFYSSIMWLSWQNIVVGDPLCSLGPPAR